MDKWELNIANSIFYVQCTISHSTNTHSRMDGWAMNRYDDLELRTANC